MKVYAASVLLYAFSLEETLQIARELGYDGVEVWHYHLLASKESPAKLRQLAQELNLSLSLHALSWDLNFTSQLPGVRESSLELLMSSIDVAAELGANPVIVHPGRITAPNDDSELYWPLLIDGVTRLARHSASRGINLSMEVMEHIPKEFFITPSDANRLLSAVEADNVAITFDAAHVPWDIQPLAYLTQLERVDHVHISDANAGKIHLPLGDGERDFRPLLRYVSHQMSACITIEGMEYSRTTALAKRNKEQYDLLLRQSDSDYPLI
ncbi:MAG: sugar phosphate isomerase/epimerase [Caldilineaceae bacterium]|nr:sugar phosphate isomerase/epimerase [Caldilineaceae bacterium]